MVKGQLVYIENNEPSEDGQGTTREGSLDQTLRYIYMSQALRHNDVHETQETQDKHET